MRKAYGFELSESCMSCKYRRDGFFCQLSPPELKDFDGVKRVAAYPAGAVLFAEQQTPKGFFLLCEGEVKLCVSSSEGKGVVLRVARPGDAIGMWATLSGAPYEATAVCLRPCQVAFVSSTDFRQYLRKHPDVFERTANFLGLHYKHACDQLGVVGLGTTVFERVAKFLLDRAAEAGAPKSNMPFTLPLSHDEIAAFIGASRESVTRAFSEFRKSGLIERQGATFIIPNREALAASRPSHDQTRSSGLRQQLLRMDSAAIQKQPRLIRWPERQRRANRRKRA
jgi:CRP/FNR family transcriptional regulator, cyclic AMP receptor protein